MRRAEVLDNAARHIQGRFRTFITRKEFVKTREASVSVQAYCRGKHLGLSWLIIWLYSFVLRATYISKMMTENSKASYCFIH
jgi:hypothetical protein